MCMQVRGRWGLAPAEGGPRPVKLTVRRDALLEDAYRALSGAGTGIKGRLMVRRRGGRKKGGRVCGGHKCRVLLCALASGCDSQWM